MLNELYLSGLKCCRQSRLSDGRQKRFIQAFHVSKLWKLLNFRSIRASRNIYLNVYVELYEKQLLSRGMCNSTRQTKCTRGLLICVCAVRIFETGFLCLA